MSLLNSASLCVTPNGYKAGTLYSVIPNTTLGDMTVVRATTATRVNSAGLIESVANNVPRLDYSNGTCPSILVEPQRSNLNFPSIPTQSGNGTLVQNAIISPDGTINANSFVPISNGFIYANVIVTTVQSYTFSLYLKGTVNGQKVRLTGDLQGSLATLTLTTEWIRYSVTFTGVIGGQNFYILSGGYLSPSENNLFYFWGWQLEEGSYPTSYIPTTSAAVTRNADVISKTGISALIGQTEGTLFVELDISNTEDTRVPIIISSANPSSSTSDAYFYINGAGNLVFEVYTAGIGQCSISAGAVQVGVQKLAFVYKNNDFAFYRNGTQIGVDTSGTVVSGFDRLYLGCYTNGALQLNDRINSAVLFPTRLTNAELASLTTI
jgi:hypothetical protein